MTDQTPQIVGLREIFKQQMGREPTPEELKEMNKSILDQYLPEGRHGAPDA